MGTQSKGNIIRVMYQTKKSYLAHATRSNHLTITPTGNQFSYLEIHLEFYLGTDRSYLSGFPSTSV